MVSDGAAREPDRPTAVVVEAERSTSQLAGVVLLAEPPDTARRSQIALGVGRDRRRLISYAGSTGLWRVANPLTAPGATPMVASAKPRTSH